MSAKAKRIAAIPAPPADATPCASAETHVGGPPVAGSGDSLSTAFRPARPSGRVSRRACGGTEAKPVRGAPRGREPLRARARSKLE